MDAAGYALGIDLGTTWTAAATCRPGQRPQMVELGSHGAAIPSVVVAMEDGSYLVGEAAARRALLEPTRVAREFKRRVGDSVPLVLGGRPCSAESLMAQLLLRVVEEVTRREGGPPARLVLTHPANWGPYRLEMLDQVVDLAGGRSLAGRTGKLTEPGAAAVTYAAAERPPPGATVAVYDLGGGTFDVAILAQEGDAFAVLGRAGGIDRLGGIDFDAALLRFVLERFDAQGLEDRALDDDTLARELLALRSELVDAKEALSADTEVTVGVRLDGRTGTVRVTRREFEEMIGPLIDSTIVALDRTLSDSGVAADRIHAVLLVGGSSRIPLVAQRVVHRLGRPVALDIHPKHAVALGAAIVGARGLAPATPPPARNPPTAPPTAPPAAAAEPPTPVAITPPAPAPPPAPTPAAPAPPPAVPRSPEPPVGAATRSVPVPPAPAAPHPAAGAPPAGTSVPVPPAPGALAGSPPVARPPGVPPAAPPHAPGGRRRTGGPALVVVLVLVVVVLGALAAALLTGGDDGTGGEVATETTVEVLGTDPGPSGAQFDDLLAFLEIAGAADRDLRLSPGGTANVPVCRTALDATAAELGAHDPAAARWVPQGLVPSFATFDDEVAAVAVDLVDAYLRRWTRCVETDWLDADAEAATLAADQQFVDRITTARAELQSLVEG